MKKFFLIVCYCMQLAHAMHSDMQKAQTAQAVQSHVEELKKEYEQAQHDNDEKRMQRIRVEAYGLKTRIENLNKYKLINEGQKWGILDQLESLPTSMDEDFTPEISQQVNENLKPFSDLILKKQQEEPARKRREQLKKIEFRTFLKLKQQQNLSEDEETQLKEISKSLNVNNEDTPSWIKQVIVDTEKFDNYDNLSKTEKINFLHHLTLLIKSLNLELININKEYVQEKELIKNAVSYLETLVQKIEGIQGGASEAGVYDLFVPTIGASKKYVSVKAQEESARKPREQLKNEFSTFLQLKQQQNLSGDEEAQLKEISESLKVNNKDTPSWIKQVIVDTKKFDN